MNRFALISLGLSALVNIPLGAQRADVHLAGGAEIRAPVLRETDEAVYLDLGHDVLRVPRDAITGLVTDEPATAEIDALEGTAEIDDFQEDLELIRQAIVLVSNPHGFGAGFIIDPSGLILTNFHVVGDEEFHRVTLYRPGSAAPVHIDDVELIAFSRLRDIALLQIEPDALPDEPLIALTIADDHSAGVGDPCFAIGNPGMGRSILAQTVSEGIISSLQRNLSDMLYIQTTAAVNPGNSGGPLLSGQGQVIGLITYKAWLQENIAFALPTHEIHRFLNSRTAFLFNDLNPNAGHRYLSPDGTEE